MARILITGGLGTIGTNISDLYLEQGHSIDIIDLCDQSRHQFAKNYLLNKRTGNKLKIYTEKLEDFTAPDIEQYDFIIHAAANTNIPGSRLDPVLDFNNNVLATHKLLEQLRAAKRKIPTFVFSSVKPYAVDRLSTTLSNLRYVWNRNCIINQTFNIKNGINEDFPLKSDEPYAATKCAQSAMCQSYAISYDLPIVVCRFSNLYATMRAKHGHGWLTTFCLLAALDQTISVEGDGAQCRDMLYYDDIFSCINLAIENINKTKGEIYNVGGGFENVISVWEAVNLLREISGKDLKITMAPGRANEDLVFITDYSKFAKITGWKPQVSVREGIERIYNWALENKETLKELV